MTRDRRASSRLGHAPAWITRPLFGDLHPHRWRSRPARS